VAQILGDFGELTIETDQIEVTSALPQADKNWRYTDRQGHEHYWDDGYPTLAVIYDAFYWCQDCGVEHADTHLECPTCQERIVPGTFVEMGRRFVPGRSTYRLNGEPITKERYEEIRGDWIGHQPNSRSDHGGPSTDSGA
jgi:hypothetical protein